MSDLMGKGLQPNPGKGLTPEYIESVISAAGREAVFARARALGWTADNSPPLWVWHQIALEVNANRLSAAPALNGMTPAGFA